MIISNIISQKIGAASSILIVAVHRNSATLGSLFPSQQRSANTSPTFKIENQHHVRNNCFIHTTLISTYLIVVTRKLHPRRSGAATMVTVKEIYPAQHDFPREAFRCCPPIERSVGSIRRFFGCPPKEAGSINSTQLNILTVCISIQFHETQAKKGSGDRATAQAICKVLIPWKNYTLKTFGTTVSRQIDRHFYKNGPPKPSTSDDTPLVLGEEHDSDSATDGDFDNKGLQIFKIQTVVAALRIQDVNHRHGQLILRSNIDKDEDRLVESNEELSEVLTSMAVPPNTSPWDPGYKRDYFELCLDLMDLTSIEWADLAWRKGFKEKVKLDAAKCAEENPSDPRPKISIRKPPRSKVNGCGVC